MRIVLTIAGCSITAMKCGLRIDLHKANKRIMVDFINKKLKFFNVIYKDGDRTLLLVNGLEW